MSYYIISFLLTLLLVFSFKKLALKYNIVDKPNERKVHQKPKPLLGGLAIYCSIALTYSYYINFQFTYEIAIIMLLALGLVLVGLYDDFYDINAGTKLFFQILISLGTSIVIGGVDKIEIYGLVFNFNDWQGILLETIWMIALINAFNLVDGLDGLSSGMGIISLVSLLIMTIINQDTTSIILILILIGALLGFLYYNFYPSTIFLGDSGSMLLGFLISIISISSYKTVTLTSSMLLILIAFMPFLDVGLAILRRKKSNQKAFAPDSLHFHHRLMLKGYTHTSAVLILYVIMIFYAAIAVMLEFVDSTSIKIILLGSLIPLTIFIFEKLYLLSDRYAYISKALKKPGELVEKIKENNANRN